ncbi:MAG: hypothetical protein K2O68_02545 [Mucispirillum sp.]|nr:hypothetical protein [Mucispirillum sp.]
MAFYCKYCGKEEKELRVLLNGYCSKSPSKKHTAYDGNNTNPFLCKHCGKKEKELRVLVNGYCSKSPTKHHEPL